MTGGITGACKCSHNRVLSSFLGGGGGGGDLYNFIIKITKIPPPKIS